MADEIKKLSGRLKEHGTEFNELKDPDSDAGVAGEAGEVGDQGGLAHAGVALQEDRVVTEGDDPAEVAEVPAHLLGEDVALQQAAPHAPAGVPRRHLERPAEGAQGEGGPPALAGHQGGGGGGPGGGVEGEDASDGGGRQGEQRQVLPYQRP